MIVYTNTPYNVTPITNRKIGTLWNQKAEMHMPVHRNQDIIQHVTGIHKIQNHAQYSTYQKRVQNLIHMKNIRWKVEFSSNTS